MFNICELVSLGINTPKELLFISNTEDVSGLLVPIPCCEKTEYPNKNNTPNNTAFLITIFCIYI